MNVTRLVPLYTLYTTSIERIIGIQEKLTRGIATLLLPYIPSVPIPQKGKTGISTLLCHDHVRMFIYMLSSFYRATGIRLPCQVHGDGTLTTDDIRMLSHKFPGITILRKSQIDKAMAPVCAAHPAIAAFRSQKNDHIYSRKLTDPILLVPFRRVIYIDADVLFFRPPARVISWIQSGESTPLYAAEPREPQWGVADGWTHAGYMLQDALGIRMDLSFNSGFMCFEKRIYTPRATNHILSFMVRVQLHKTWIAEQYASALIFARRNNKKLGREYMHIGTWNRRVLLHLTTYSMVHFAYRAKAYFYAAACMLAIKTRLFTRQVGHTS